MHPVLFIPHIVEDIFDFATQQADRNESESSAPSAELAKYRLAWVCRVWRAVLAPRVFIDLYFYMQRSPYFKVVEDDIEYTKSSIGSMVEVVDGRFLYQTNMDLIPAHVQPRTVTVHLESGDLLSSSAVGYLTHTVFVQNSWPAVKELYIVVGEPDLSLFRDQVDYRPMERVVQAVLSQAPNVSAYMMESNELSGPLMNLQAAFGVLAINITRLDLHTNGCDYSRLELPALADLTVHCETDAEIDMLPPFSAHKIQRLQVFNITPRVLYHMFAKAKVEGTVLYPQLEELAIELDSLMGDLGPPDLHNPVVRYEFPKLCSLHLKTSGQSTPNVYDVFANAPLKYLALSDVHFFDRIDVANLPSLVSVSLKRQAGEDYLLPQAIVNDLVVEPVSSLRHLTVGYMDNSTFKSCRFGCLSLRSLYIGGSVSAGVLENILGQLPALVDVGIGYWQTAQCKTTKLKTILSRVDVGNQSMALNTSLARLEICAEHRSGRVGHQHRGVGWIVPVLARVPSLEKLSMYGWSPGDGEVATILQAVADKRVCRHAKHFADLLVCVEPSMESHLFEYAE